MKRQLVVATSLALLVFAASPSFAVNGNIGIYADEFQGICAQDLQYQVGMKLYVYALLQGGSVGGISGAEYQITQSASVDWTMNEDFTPATLAGALKVGAGALAGGVNLAYAPDNCQTGPGSVLLQCINLVDLTGLDAGVANTLRVEGHLNPGNPFFRCPLFTLCDEPAFTKVCLGSNLDIVECPFPPGAIACKVSTSGEFFVNPTPEFANCTVAVEETTWSKMKSLYN